MSDFEKVFASKISRFVWFYSVIRHILHFPWFLEKHGFELKLLLPVRFWFDKIQRVRFWVENFTTCQSSYVLLLQFAKFSCVHQNKARFGNVLGYGVGLISQVILSELALRTPTVINVTKHIRTANSIRVCLTTYSDKEWFLTRLY